MNKKFYLACAITLAQISISSAQENFSFETNEGFTVGTINDQQNWEVTEGYDGFLTNQLITNIRASDGEQAFKNGHQSDYDPQWLPIFGASKAFETLYPYENFTISYDVFITQRNGADFEFNLYAINDQQQYIPVVGIGMENRGYIYITKDIDYDFEYADAGENWPINTWNNIKVEVNATDIKYYLNHNLIHITPNYSQLPIHGLTLLHNNYGGEAFYDNFKINEQSLNTNDLVLDNIQLYPNPVKETLFINTTELIDKIEIYDVLGTKLLSSNNDNSIATTSLKFGTYITKIFFKDGKSVTRKFIKK